MPPNEDFWDFAGRGRRGHQIENAPLSKYQMFQSNVINTQTQADGFDRYPPRS
jgi:hypothetical protein